MKKVSVEEAQGLVLAHDITEIVPGKRKGVAFPKGKVIEKEDIPRLLDLGKRHLYVFEGPVEGLHEDEAAVRIVRAIINDHMEYTLPREGKVVIKSTVKGLFYVNTRHLFEMNRIKDVLLSTVPNRHPVGVGDEVAAARIIPLYAQERQLKRVERTGAKGIIKISPFKSMKVGLVATGNEVYSGRVQDGSSTVEEKFRGYGLDMVGKRIVPDEISMIRDAIRDLLDSGADIVVTTAGLSVDPDDVTREGIEATGAEVLFYGAPVFPGAMFLMARLEGRYILGAPACVYHDKYTVLDLVLMRIMAGERVIRDDMVKLSYGGFCLHCPECHYPMCSFGKGV
ncbi:MAG: molybdopterin-binding protein [Syntrophorhabdus aromaticivorans]|uniref:Molybdopterin molybdenumtransferase n=1 Tax=Syntrophorhabdus aromaticivorans TaxID=328301 RepID=A0A971S098_9BACT|nr:molybdopterin-binding protein [Syntrophorhabdus aromaticivorans]